MKLDKFKLSKDEIKQILKDAGWASILLTITIAVLDYFTKHIFSVDRMIHNLVSYFIVLCILNVISCWFGKYKKKENEKDNENT